MRRLLLLLPAVLVGLFLIGISTLRADDEFVDHAKIDTPVQPKTEEATDAKPSAPRCVLVLTPHATGHADPIARRSPSDRSPRNRDEFVADSFEGAFEVEAIDDGLAWNPSTPIPKRGAPSVKKPETLLIKCTDAKISVSTTANNGVNYTIDCTGPVQVDNGPTFIRCSKLRYADGMLILADDVTISQPDSPAGMLFDLRAKQLTLKFQLEKFSISHVDDEPTAKRQPSTDVDAFAEPTFGAN